MASAQSATNLSDCSYRNGTGIATKWANQICWLDLKGLTTNGKVTKNIGGYTLTFDVTVGTNATLSTLTNPGWNQAAFGKVGTGFFERYTSSTVQDVLQMNYLSTSNPSATITLSNVKLTDAAGATIPSFRLMVADAESTGAGTPGELISVDNSSGGVEALDRLTPATYKQACTGTDAVFGASTEPNRSEWKFAGNRSRDFVCYSRSTGTYGTFVTSADMNGSAGTLEISMASDGRGAQAVALGIGMGRVSFDSQSQLATVGSGFESAVLGTTPTADYKPFLRYNGTDTPIDITYNSTVPVLRHIAAGGVTQDQYAFKSTLATAQPEDAFKRYDPVWSCTLTTASGTATTYTIREGSIPAGFALTANKDTGLSDLQVDAPENRQVNCTVKWESRFFPATLELRKSVSGSAADFADVQRTKYDFTYTCSNLTVGGVAFSTAYPGTKLTNTVTLSRGQVQSVTLPKGSACTVTEKPTLAAPTGTSLDLQWNPTTTPPAPPANPNNGNNTFQVTVGAAQPTVPVDKAAANNRYDYRTGSLTLTKDIDGPPVTDGFRIPEYRFELVCPETNLPRVEKAMSMSGGTRGTVVFDNVPVGQKCAIRPLTDLSGTDALRYKFLGRVATLNGATISPDPAVNNAYTFTLPDAQGATADMHFQTSYDYQLRDITLRKLIDGPAAGSADFADMTFTVNYKCTAPTKLLKQGTVELKGNGGEAVAAAVPVGSTCIVWENTPGDTANTLYKGTVLRPTNASDTTTDVPNSSGQTTTVLTVWPSQAGESNLVTVINTYDYKLSPVTLTKNVVDNVAVTVPTSFTFSFNCGTRNIGATAVALTGTAQVDSNQTVTLVADETAANANGAMQVPYGNTCKFTEVQPELGPGVIMDTDADSVALKVGDGRTGATVTNTFHGAGSGLTIKQSLRGESHLFPSGASITYLLECSAAGTTPGTYIPLAPVEITLKDGEPRNISADTLPRGSQCSIKETSPETLTRTNTAGDTYSIDREVLATSADPDLSNTSTDPAYLRDRGLYFDISDQTVLSFTDTYSYKNSTISATKQVNTEGSFSQARIDDKKKRNFAIQFRCLNPDGTELFNITTSITHGQTISQGGVPEGAVCSGSETATTPATGVTLTTSIDLTMEAGGTQHIDGNSITFTAKAGNDAITLTNLYTRRTADVSLEKKGVFPGSIRSQYANQADLQAVLKNHTFTMVCLDSGYESAGAIYTGESHIKGEGTTEFADVPVGTVCTIKGDNFDSLKLTPMKNAAGNEITAYIKPVYVDWVIDRAGGHAEANLDNGTTTSPGILISDENVPAPTDATGRANYITLTNHYDYEQAPVRLVKNVAGNPGDLKLLTADTHFNFAMSCEVIGYTTNVIGEGDASVPASISRSDLNNWMYTSPVAMVPAGSLCTFTETSPSGVPQELSMRVDASSNADPVDKQPNVATGRAPEPGSTTPTQFTFTDTFERQMRQVYVLMRQAGYLTGARSDGYVAKVTCGTVQQEVMIPLSAVTPGQLPTTDGTRTAGRSVNLPAGLECTVSFDSSPALEARGQVEAINGNRRPLMRFASWTDGVYAGANRTLLNTPYNEVREPEKTYSSTFTVPSSAETDYVVGAEIFHPRAMYDVQLTKLSKGAEGDGKTFTFAYSCGDPASAELALESGEKASLTNVPVDSTCTINEVSDGNSNVNSVLTAQPNVANTLLGNFTVSSGSSTDPTVEPARSVSFTVLPTTADDTASAGERWALTATNSFPGISVTKRIPGTPVSAVTGAVANRAILADKARSFEVTYTVKNTGVFDATVTEVKDESLAGYTVNGTMIPDGGVVPSSVCAVGTLAPGGSAACTFIVDISDAPTNETFSYYGDVQVTATAAHQTLTATDGYGALRLTGIIGALLPDTGMQTLVWLLAIGLVLFGFGAWRYLRREAESEIEEGEDSHEIN